MRKKFHVIYLFCLVLILSGLCACGESSSEPEIIVHTSDGVTSTSSMTAEQAEASDKTETVTSEELNETEVFDKTKSSTLEHSILSETSDSAATDTSENSDSSNSVKDEVLDLSGYQVGDVFQLGYFNYNKNEPLEWVVLTVEEDRMLVLCKKIHFTYEYGAYPWKNSSLCQYLNGPFLSSAFTKEERDRILHSKLSYTVHFEDGTEKTETARNSIFVLSKAEVEAYFPSASERKIPSEFGFPFSFDGKGVTAWWVRDAGYFPKSEAYSSELYGVFVDENGEFSEKIDFYALGVRPAMWLERKS